MRKLSSPMNSGLLNFMPHGADIVKHLNQNIKNKPSDYNGRRTADALGDESFKQLRKLTKDKASGGNKVVTLTDSNFRSKVLDGGEPWLVEFYAPWCGHCQRLEPEWKSAASEVHEKTGNKVKMGMLDATQHQNTASQYGIQGYPTIKMFFPDGRVEDYNGGRTASDIVQQ